MKNTLLFLLLSFICISSFSQPSDFLLIKKNNRTVKTFFAGTNISFQTLEGMYQGRINAINKDSLFISQFDIRQAMTILGVYVLDTVAVYKLKFNYNNIIKIDEQRTRGFDVAASGGSLLGGGILLTAFGLGTRVFTKPGSQYYASKALVIGSATLGGIGYLLLRSKNSRYKIGNKYQLEYVKVK